MSYVERGSVHEEMAGVNVLRWRPLQLISGSSWKYSFSILLTFLILVVLSVMCSIRANRATVSNWIHVIMMLMARKSQERKYLYVSVASFCCSLYGLFTTLLRGHHRFQFTAEASRSDVMPISVRLVWNLRLVGWRLALSARLAAIKSLKHRGGI